MSWDPTTPTTKLSLHVQEMEERITRMREGFAEYLDGPVPVPKQKKKRNYKYPGLEGPIAGLP